MLRRSFLQLIGGSAFGVLSGTSIAQSHVGLAHKAASGISAASKGSLFQQGTDISPIRPAFAGPICAKGRITPEFEDFCDGSGVVFQQTFSSAHGYVTYDDQNVIAGSQSTKIVPLRPGGDGPSYFHYDFPNGTTYDWRHKSVKIRFFIPPENHNISFVYMRLRSYGQNALYPVWRAGSRSPRTGWIEYVFTPSQNYETADVSAVDRIQLLVQRGGDDHAETYILVNGLTVWDGRLKTPLYCCTFDDNYIRQYEAAKHAASKGIPISLFINKFCFDDPENPRGVANNTVGMSVAQNQELAQLGCVHINHGVSHSPPRDAGDGVTDLWSNPNTQIEGLISDIENNRQWLNETGLGFGSHIFGSPQEWWLDHHEQHLRPYLFGRPRQGRGMGSYGLLTMWDEHTEVRSACDTHLANAYKMLQANVGTLLWTPGTYPQCTLREWTDGGIYEVANAAWTSETPAHADWTYLRQRSDEDEGDRAIQIEVWNHYASSQNEGTLQKFKDYMDVVAAHIAAGRLRAVDLRDLYENYLYTTTPPDTLPGDIDGDGKVDLNDFAIMAENWLKETDSN